MRKERKKDVTIEYCHSDSCRKSNWHKIKKSGELECMSCGTTRPGKVVTRGKKPKSRGDQWYDNVPEE